MVIILNIKNIIYSYIYGDCYGLSRINNKNDSIKLIRNNELNIDKGYFSSMTTYMLAVIDSLTKYKDINNIDILNRMCTSFILGKYTNNMHIYEIDNYTFKVLEYYSKTNNLNALELDNNIEAYSLSRVLPIALFSINNEVTLNSFISLISITNTNELVILGCFIYYRYLINIINGLDKHKALKINIPSYFKEETILVYKSILKGKIKLEELNDDNNIVNILKIVFYTILNYNNYYDAIYFINNLNGKKNIYCPLIMTIYSIINNEVIDIKDIKNKKMINKYIKDFERIVL